ncbi:bifunctional orotidine-5'-phosphate decarboxylase/orotate phosphoribosyltransferase [Synechococcus sp. BSF8S]|uniref:bifunctional orotidine-5'-phosphate decarboxylase/orotate phosphoribosyltransferase n=1 Tax=unclassified Synechococcus TaxID=2626047 RepID=UPI00162478EE|nr:MULTISPECIES: bifunctional orotidine-5'-phosphate decarboxylase/orotate phosphoribosyltransferase [unclassified Synechococcus]MBC1260874.1 bifunctional orotidine-5'-phosphate decarboxylase/orotate phosphoribosyltransferase [Synechococcus sp. BSF8S]MBC1263550.1 bifunctional orotidine-5'-phosphate decarboxylase/orotate phosphoribosyltransferase [Synechococcus sp. BSA11S]
MSFFVKLTEAMASRQSLLITGLDPNPEMLQTWTRHNTGSGSFLAQARRWIKAVIEATSDSVCAYKPSLGFYQALGPIGIELLREVRELVPLELPLILDAKHGDLNTSSALAHYLFRDLGVDAVTLSPLAGQDIAAPFLLYPDRAVVLTCHSSNPSSRVVQHHPDEDDPLYITIVRETQRWGTPEHLLLEVGTSDPAVLARVRREAPERFLILRSLWGEEERLEALLKAGLNASADGLLLPLPQHLLVEEGMAAGTRALRRQIETMRAHWEGGTADRCDLWLPAQRVDAGSVEQQRLEDQHVDDQRLDELLVDLFDIGCLLFGEYVQASGAVFNYYIDLRRIISDPNLFHRVLHAYAEPLGHLKFDRIAGIPYGSLPTATGLSLQLHVPLIYPRKEVKAHGARRLIEGDFEEGETVVVVDDILITGGSVLEGIGKLESSGLKVRDVVVFIDHGGNASGRLASAGYTCHAVVGIERITSVLRAAGRLSQQQADLLAEHTGAVPAKAVQATA